MSGLILSFVIVETPSLHLESEVSNKILFIFKKERAEASVQYRPFAKTSNVRVGLLWTTSVVIILSKRLPLGFLVKTLKIYACSFYKHTNQRRRVLGLGKPHVLAQVSDNQLPEFSR